MAFVKKDWHNLPLTDTPITDDDLDRIENGIEENDKRLNGTKAIDNTLIANDFECKNLIDSIYSIPSKTSNYVTFTNNGDGTITANGTASGGNASINLYSNDLSLKAGTYVLSGCPSGGSSEKYYIATNIQGASVFDYGDGVVINIPSDVTGKSIWIAVVNGQSVSNLVFKPQLEIGSEVTSFTPYKNFNATDIFKYQHGEIMFDFTSNLTTSYDNQKDKTLKWIGFNSQTSNSPDNTASGIVISFRDTNDWGWQTAFYNGKIRIRQKQNGTWGSWISSN